MFGLGPMEIGIIVLLAVLLFGNRLPKIARSFGSTIVEFKKGFKHGVEEPVQEMKDNFHEATSEVRRELTNVAHDVNQELREVQASARNTVR